MMGEFFRSSSYLIIYSQSGTGLTHFGVWVRHGLGEAGMSGTTHFDQECPTCGRSLRIRRDYLGRRVICQHCQGQFEACDPNSAAYPPSDSGLALLKRANELLDKVDSSKSIVLPR